MHSKVKDLRNFVSRLLESKGMNWQIMNGHVVVNLTDRPDLHKVGQRVIYVLPDDTKDRLEWKIRTQLKPDDPRDEMEIAQLNLYLMRDGKEGVIVDTSSSYVSEVEFQEGEPSTTHCMSDNLWAIIDEESPDFRPDEPLPEDYYAL